MLLIAHRLYAPRLSPVSYTHLDVYKRQVQADEIHVTTQAGVLWLAMAMMVSTRLWLGGAIRRHRDHDLLAALVALVHACAQVAPLLWVTDGLSTYIRRCV